MSEDGIKALDFFFILYKNLSFSIFYHHRAFILQQEKMYFHQYVNSPISLKKKYINVSLIYNQGCSSRGTGSLAPT